jgi:murein DD-endopeptidase MepM/ murein hydrolase activator NlpD
MYLDSFKIIAELLMKSKWNFLTINLILSFFWFSFLFIPQAFSLEPRLKIIEGTIKQGETFSCSLKKRGITRHWLHLIVSKLRPYVDFKKIRKTESYQWISNEEGILIKFVFEVSPIEVYEIEQDSKGIYLAQKKEIPLEIVLKKVEGEIKTTLTEAMQDIGEYQFLATALSEILAWRTDFSLDARGKDRFKIVVEKIFKGDQFIKYGAIHAFEYQSGKQIIRGIRFKDRYYDEKGYPLEKTFLRAPCRYDYISSGFNQKRRHPIMGGVHPHLGIDYAAPIGTPVWAVAEGVIDLKGWEEGFGKQVVLQHPNGYRSYYSHLSKYGPGIEVGKHVQQKQIIGYVGSTGFSTGPHLDYRLSKNGEFINPYKEKFSNSPPIPSKDFYELRDKWLDMLVNEVPFD